MVNFIRKQGGAKVKKLVIFISVIALLFISSASHADTPVKKLGRGIANIFTCPIELPYRIGQANEEDGPFAAFTWGILEGICRTGMRLVVGVYEVISFPIPFPAYYEPIIDDPEFFLEDGIF